MSAESSITAEAALRTARLDRTTAELVRWAGGSLMGLLVLAAVVLGWRRLDAGLLRPLRLPDMVAVATILAALAAACRRAWRVARQGRAGGRLGVGAAVVLSAAVVVVAAAVSLPGTSPGGLAVLWGIVLVEECWSWLGTPTAAGRFRRRFPTARRTRKARGGQHERSAPPAVSEAPVLATLPRQDVFQQLTRSRAPDGSETLSGWLRVAVAAGQRSASVHVAFCPPFARTPRATVEQVDGPEARIKTVQLLPYGARFDLKLAAPSGAAGAVLLQLSAASEPPQAPEG